MLKVGIVVEKDREFRTLLFGQAERDRPPSAPIRDSSNAEIGQGASAASMGQVRFSCSAPSGTKLAGNG
jgi:hypothetical protein